MAQMPRFHVLKDAKAAAGCFLTNQKGEYFANLAAGEMTDKNAAIFNFTGKDIVLPSIKGTKKYPEAYGNENYKVYLHAKSLGKEGESCLENFRYEAKIIFKGKTYYYALDGFCGC